jgi:hypothetical protein
MQPAGTKRAYKLLRPEPKAKPTRDSKPIDSSPLIEPAATLAASASTSASATTTSQKLHLRGAGGEVWTDPTLCEWSAHDFRIFCGDLGREVGDDTLLNAFKRYSSVAHARVVRDKHTGHSRGYGFVSFSNATDFAKALKEMNGKYVGSRPLKLRKSAWQERNITQEQAEAIKAIIPKRKRKS